MAQLPASYVEVHRYDGAALEHGERERAIPCAVQPRDVAVLRDVHRYKFLTAPQLRELWWPEASVQAADRRLLKLFHAEHLERFRPIARRGSYPWTYHLGEQGHRVLQDAGLIASSQRYRARRIYDYGHVLHEIQLNAWVLAYRRALGSDLLSWDGETHIQPPPGIRESHARLSGGWSVKGLHDTGPRSICPDAVVEVAADRPDQEPRLLLIEYDRTRRLDKNYDKLRRYDSFLNWWWELSDLAERRSPPFVLFVCQDEEQRSDFLAAGDRELIGHRWHPSVDSEHHTYFGRRQMLFVVEVDVHAGLLEARRLPSFPAGHSSRQAEVRRVRIAPAFGGTSADSQGMTRVDADAEYAA